MELFSTVGTFETAPLYHWSIALKSPVELNSLLREVATHRCLVKWIESINIPIISRNFCRPATIRQASTFVHMYEVKIVGVNKFTKQKNITTAPAHMLTIKYRYFLYRDRVLPKKYENNSWQKDIRRNLCRRWCTVFWTDCTVRAITEQYCHTLSKACKGSYFSPKMVGAAEFY